MCFFRENQQKTKHKMADWTSSLNVNGLNTPIETKNVVEWIKYTIQLYAVYKEFTSNIGGIKCVSSSWRMQSSNLRNFKHTTEQGLIPILDKPVRERGAALVVEPGDWDLPIGIALHSLLSVQWDWLPRMERGWRGTQRPQGWERRQKWLSREATHSPVQENEERAHSPFPQTLPWP